MKITLFVSALLCSMFCVDLAKAELILTAGLSGSNTPGDVGIVAEGMSTVGIDLYLTQRGRDRSDSEFRLQRPSSLPDGFNTLGFGGGHVQISLDPSGDLRFSGGAAMNAAPAMEFVTGVFPNTSSDPNRQGLTFQENGLLSFDAFATDVAGGNSLRPLYVENTREPIIGDVEGTIAENSIRIGTFTVEVGPNANGAYSIDLVAPPLVSPDLVIEPFFGQSFTNAYEPSAGSFTLFVGVVPEPSTVSLLGVVLAGIASRRRRRSA